MTLQIGEHIRRLRREKDLTQEQLAGALGVSFQAVSRWESGGSYPDIELLPGIAAFFGVTVDALLDVPAARREKELEHLLVQLQEESRKRPFDAGKVCRDLREIRKYHAGAPSSRLLLLCILPDPDCLRDEAVLPELRRTVDALLQNCTGGLRESLILSMAVWEDDRHLEEFLTRYATPGDLSRERLRLHRARGRGDPDAFAPLWQAHALENLLELLDPCLWKSPTAKEDVEAMRGVFETQARLFAALGGEVWDRARPISGDGSLDCLAGARLHFGRCYAAFLAGAGDTEDALRVLEDTVTYLEKILARVESGGAVPLDPLPLFDRLCKDMTLREIPGDAGAVWEFSREGDGGAALSHARISPAFLLERLRDDAFAPLRGDPRFEDCLARTRRMGE